MVFLSCVIAGSAFEVVFAVWTNLDPGPSTIPMSSQCHTHTHSQLSFCFNSVNDQTVSGLGASMLKCVAGVTTVIWSVLAVASGIRVSALWSDR